MKAILVSIFLFVVFSIISSALASTTFAADYYLSPSGNDSSNGTSSSTPWKTATKVNNVDLNSGDHVYFQSGQSFPVTAKIYLQNSDSGTAANPVTITTYGGTSPAILNVSSSDGVGIYGSNVSGVSVSNLKIVGPGNANADTVVGVLFYNTSGTQAGLVLDKIDVSKFGRGIVIGSGGGAAYNDIRVTNVSVYDNVFDGMLTFSASNPVLNNVYIGYSSFYNNTGKAGLSKNSGSGLIVGGVNGGIVEHNEAYNNGSLADANEGPVGIWAYQANNLVFQFNESHHNRTGGFADGGGFDLDGGVSNSIVQYNYSHDNDGACLGVYQYSPALPWKDNVFRYNVCQNDARKNGYGAITFWNNSTGIVNAQFYNNTIFISPTGNTTPAAVTFFTQNATSGLVMRNNIFYTTGASAFVYDPYGQTNSFFQGNDYYNSSGNFKWKWANSDYSSFAAWQTATNQEKVNGANVGLSVNPQLTNPGNGGTLGEAQLTALSAYKLLTNSPMINAGLNLNSLFGTNVGTRDYYGGAIPQGTNFDIGAHEYGGGSTPAPTATPAPTPGTCSDADINQDGTVNGSDVTILLSDFLKTTLANSRSDVNRNGMADLTDYGIVAKYYLQACL